MTETTEPQAEATKKESVVEAVETKTPSDKIAVIHLEYDTQTGDFRMQAFPNAVMCFGMLEMCKETISRQRIKAELAQEIMAAKPAPAPKIVVPSKEIVAP